MTDSKPKVIQATQEELEQLLAGPHKNCQSLAILGPKTLNWFWEGDWKNIPIQQAESRFNEFELVIFLEHEQISLKK